MQKYGISESKTHIDGIMSTQKFPKQGEEIPKFRKFKILAVGQIKIKLYST